MRGNPSTAPWALCREQADVDGPAGGHLGVLRIVLGWSLPKVVIGGWTIVTALAFIAPPESIGIAYDAGGVTSSVVTVPLVTALGIGLASSLSGLGSLDSQ